MKRWVGINLISICLVLFAIQGEVTKGNIQVTTNTVAIQFPDMIRFELAARAEDEIVKATLFYQTNAQSCQQGAAQQEVDLKPGKEIDVSWEWELKRSGALPPGAEVTWYWKIQTKAGDLQQTEAQTLVIEDRRHNWQEVRSLDENVTVQWYSGTQAFGKRVLRIVLQSLERLANELGVEAEQEIRIIIYPTSEELREALITTYEWTGGVALPQYSSTMIGASPGDEAWLEEVIPHELAHLLVSQLVFNCKGVWLPTWLSEGLAVVSEAPISREENDRIAEAYENGELQLLHTLEQGFSPYTEQAGLNYTQSGAVVEYLAETYGPAKIGNLLAKMQGGLLSDDALEEIYGMNTYELDSAWRIASGFAALPSLTPTPEGGEKRTEIPTIALYTSVVQASETGTPTPAPSATVTSLPSSTYTPEPTDTMTVDGDTSKTATAIPDENSNPICGGFGAFIFLVLGMIFWSRRKT